MKIKRYLVCLGLLCSLVACGDDHSLNSNQNSIPVTVDKGPQGTSTNVPYVSVKVCAPGTDNCQTIDHVLLDSGSTGLRLLASALQNPAALTSNADASAPMLAECFPFGSGYTWGSVKKADIHLGKKTALNVPVQLINDAELPSAPAKCQQEGINAGNLKVMQANGILGISSDTVDCGSLCTGSSVARVYYMCSNGDCEVARLSIADQVPNPISKFDRDNNGVVIVFPSVRDGDATVTGRLIFGIGTRPNNQLRHANIYALDEDRFIENVLVNGTTTKVAIDTGSTGSFFNMAGDPPVCASVPGLTDKYFCAKGQTIFQFPAQTSPISVAVNTTNPVQYQQTYPLAAVNPSLTGPTGGTNTPDAATSVLGLPFFFGRSVFIGFDGAKAGSAKGPFNAF
jgi:hypothetical protein